VSEDVHHLVVVDPLDIDGARALGTALTEWLVGQGLAVADGEALRPGPAAAGAVDDGYGTDWTAWAPVRVHTEWDVYWAGEAFEGPPCRGCATPLDDAEFIAQLESWTERRAEPWLTCGACGVRARAGDWPLDASGAAGPLAVEFTEWPPLLPDRTRALEQQLGQLRSVWVRAHF
jgi:hypothetical protein